jgi:hypothetical protein
VRSLIVAFGFLRLCAANHCWKFTYTSRAASTATSSAQ